MSYLPAVAQEMVFEPTQILSSHEDSQNPATAPATQPINQGSAGKDSDHIMVAKNYPIGNDKANEFINSVVPANVQWQTDFIRQLNDGKNSIPLQSLDYMSNDNIMESLTLDQAVSLALENNNELKASIAAIKSRYWEKMGTYSQYLPSVNLDLAVGTERSRPASYNDLNGDRELDNTHARRDRSLLVRQPLLDLGVIADAFTTTNKEKLADLEKSDTQNNVALSTVAAYIKIIQSQVAVELTDEYINYLDKLSSIMRTRVDAGGTAQADLDRVISRSTLAESAKMEAVGNLQASLAEFKRLTGHVPLKIEIPKELAVGFPKNLNEATEQSLRINPQYLGFLKKMDLAKDERNKSYSNLLPKVYAQYSATYSYNAGGAANANPIDGVYATTRVNSNMIVAQWALNGLTPLSSAQSAISKENQAYFQSLDTRERIEQAIRTNYTAINNSKGRIEILRRTVDSNESVVRGFEEQFNNGTRPLFDLLDSYEQLYNSRLNLSRVIFAYSLASYQIRQQIGDIVPAIVQSRVGP